MTKLNKTGIGAVGVVLAAGMVQAQVPYLQFESSDVAAVPGVPFEVKLDLVVTPASLPDYDGVVTSLNWWLGTDLNGKDKLSILGRTFENGLSGGSPAGTAVFPESLSIQNSGHDANEYRNNADLGYVLPSGSYLSAGTHFVSVVTLLVNPSVSPGDSFPLFTTVDQTGKGWVDGTFDEASYSQQASLTITVVPEPGVYAIITGVGLLGFVIYRRLSDTKLTRA